MGCRIAIVGQAPPRTPSSTPFGRTRLATWLARARSHDQVELGYGALVDVYPGTTASGDRPPNRREIAEGRRQLDYFLRSFGPDLVVPVGKLATLESIPGNELPFDQLVGRRFDVDPFGTMCESLPVIPLPHPSGRNAWVHSEVGSELLDAAIVELEQCIHGADSSTRD